MNVKRFNCCDVNMLGTEYSNMIGYKHPCRYCDKLIAAESNTCPFCGKINPLGPLMCPKCKSPVHKDWIKCGSCGQALRIVCPMCGKETFFGDYCDKCDARIQVRCRKCHKEQSPVSDKCIYCGKVL